MGPPVAPLGVYVHFPWCLAKCPYCDFLSVAREPLELPHAAYADAVLRELERRAPSVAGYQLQSVFFGGGTPSLWEPAQLGRVLRALQALLPAGGPVEVTVECNPTSFDERRAEALLEQGVNRVSLGVQSLDAGRLQFLGRLHDVQGGLRAVRAALSAGLPEVNVDLIFGVHGQTAQQAVHEALTIAELGVTHQSVYALTIEPGTPFGALARRRRLPLSPEEVVADSFSALSEALQGAGYEHYEISNYARARRVSQHNLGYWRGADYLGLGCGAYGTLTSVRGKFRYRNVPLPDRYLTQDWQRATLDRAGPGQAQSELERLSPETLLVERLMLGLRLAEGVDLERLGRELGLRVLSEERLRRLEELSVRGRIARDGARWFIPPEAWIFADGTIAQLV